MAYLAGYEEDKELRRLNEEPYKKRSEEKKK